MRIEEKNLGGGLFRLDVAPTHWGENVNAVPTRVMDNVMRDVVEKLRYQRKLRELETKLCTRLDRNTPCKMDFARPIPFDGAEDGIDIHVDRPRREMYGGWDAEYGFRKDLTNYNRLKEVAKECNWPCREPMRGAEPSQPTQERYNPFDLDVVEFADGFDWAVCPWTL